MHNLEYFLQLSLWYSPSASLYLSDLGQHYTQTDSHDPHLILVLFFFFLLFVWILYYLVKNHFLHQPICFVCLRHLNSNSSFWKLPSRLACLKATVFQMSPVIHIGPYPHHLLWVWLWVCRCVTSIVSTLHSHFIYAEDGVFYRSIFIVAAVIKIMPQRNKLHS